MVSHLTTPVRIAEWKSLRNQTHCASALAEQALLKGSKMLCVAYWHSVRPIRSVSGLSEDFR